MTTTTLRGVVRGKIIELQADTGIDDGQEVEVVLRPVPTATPPEQGEGISRTAGALPDDENDDAILAEIAEGRKHERPQLTEK